jgi:cyclic pyranopterin phosphate synthase
MAEKFIPIADYRNAAAIPQIPERFDPPSGMLSDALGRPLHDLRISVTDRCNFRCVYCMPKEVFDKEYRFLPQSDLLTFEEITRIAKIFVAHGVEKIRLTGGEPLLRKNVEKLIEMLSGLKTADGRDLDLTLTTNGSLLVKKARSLKDAGLKRLTVSLDSLDDQIFRRMNDVDFPVADVLRGIDAAHQAGLGPIKINMVVKGGLNDREIVPMARHFRGTPHILRYIEYMDVGASNAWQMEEVIPSDEVVRRISAEMPLIAVAPNYAGETATRYRYADGNGEIGVISSVTHAFCRSCTRARLSTEGKLYNCLFATSGHDLRALLRTDRSDEEISAAIAQIWQLRNDRYSELRSIGVAEPSSATQKIEMSYIGG